MTLNQLSPDDPLSPELVLVLPPELRAQVIARLGPPIWPKPSPRVVDAPALGSQAVVSNIGMLLMARVMQLALLFVALTALTLILSAVAGAVP